jgi:hypothetical protein
MQKPFDHNFQGFGTLNGQYSISPADAHLGMPKLRDAKSAFLFRNALPYLESQEIKT